MKIIFDVPPDFANGVPVGMESVGFNVENKPVFEMSDGEIPNGGRIASDTDMIGLPSPARQLTKRLVRSAIYRDVADIDSLLGTATDAAHVLVLFACADAVSLAAATDFDMYKKLRMESLAALSGGADGAVDMVKNAEKLLTDVVSGDVIMPFMVKLGKATEVFRDVAARATAVAQVFIRQAT